MSLTSVERNRWERDGFVVRAEVFDHDDVAALRAVAEAVTQTVTERATRRGAGPEHRLADGHRIQFSSHAGIQWEWRDGSREIRLIEPCDHLDARLAALFADRRLTDPARDVLAVDRVELFTSKLNLKRAVDGSEFPWHQDYPYWYVSVEDQAADVVTAIVFLDDTTAENGAVRVLPGSHRHGPAARNPQDPSRYLADPSRIDAHREVVVEVAAGSVLFFGALLLHRSSPNATAAHRRALLPSYQPAGRPRLHAAPRREALLEQLP